MKIPYLIPSMPSADDLLPYLRRIDETRRYSNDGPLVRELEQKLCELSGASAGVCVASCTAGLTAAALYLSKGAPFAASVPLNTFAGTAQAMCRAGADDIEYESSAGWFIDSSLWDDYFQVPVCTFGMPFGGSRLNLIRNRTIIDAAAAIYTQRASEFLTVYSLHATKLLSSGEGGFIACRSEREADHLKTIINFGVDGGSHQRIYEYGFNGKMSEYHAAVGLASLQDDQRWRIHRHAWLRYSNNLSALDSMLPPAYGSGLGFPLRLPQSCDERNALDFFRAHGIEVRYGYAPFVRPSPEEKRFLCLPCYPLMSAAQVDEVSDVALQFAGGAV